MVNVTETVEFDASLGEGMRYISTRGNPCVYAETFSLFTFDLIFLHWIATPSVTFEDAMMIGLAVDGGLYVPEKARRFFIYQHWLVVVLTYEYSGT